MSKGQRSRTPKIPRRGKGGESDASLLGLVTRKTLAGGQGSTGSQCHFCGEVGSHTGQCPVVS